MNKLTQQYKSYFVHHGGDSKDDNTMELLQNKIYKFIQKHEELEEEKKSLQQLIDDCNNKVNDLNNQISTLEQANEEYVNNNTLLEENIIAIKEENTSQKETLDNIIAAYRN